VHTCSVPANRVTADLVRKRLGSVFAHVAMVTWPARNQNAGSVCQARPASSASSRSTEPSISPYGRSAA
jgi:hypothetical protein